MDLTKHIIKLTLSLAQKRHRLENNCFVVEGTKAVRDTWDYFNCRMIIATNSWYEQFGHSGHLDKLYIATKSQMERISQFTNASDVIAIYDIPECKLNRAEIEQGLTIVLDNVQDPGNLGTIIRVADWFGVKNIICSENTVDQYNHKVIQATMGAISRVKVHYLNLEQFFAQDWGLPVYGTYLDGCNIYEKNLAEMGFIIFGNEGKGISDELAEFVTDRLLIPSYPKGCTTSESLNVSIATAITLSEFRRKG